MWEYVGFLLDLSDFDKIKNLRDNAKLNKTYFYSTFHCDKCQSLRMFINKFGSIKRLLTFVGLPNQISVKTNTYFTDHQSIFMPEMISRTINYFLFYIQSTNLN